MKFVTATVPQSGQNSNAFDTEGLPIAGLVYPTPDVLDGTPALVFQTPAPGQDPSNPSAVWIPVNEISPGIFTDADDAGTLAAEQIRPWLGIPNLILEGAGAARNHFYCVQKDKKIPKFVAAATTGPGEDAAAAFAEGDLQKVYNQIARLSNGLSSPRVPNILRIALGVNQTTAAVPFTIGLAEARPNLPAPATPRRVDVTFANGVAFSTFFELAPGEKLVGIATPAAFTSGDFNLETPKPGLDPAITTDANWLTVSEYVTEQTLLTGAAPQPVLFLIGVVQGQYYAIGDLNVVELPRYLRLKGTANQGAARTVTLFIQ